MIRFNYNVILIIWTFRYNNFNQNVVINLPFYVYFINNSNSLH